MNEQPIHCAEKVIVLLSREFRISRNIRLKWYFDHLNSPISTVTAPLLLHGAGNSDKVHDNGIQVVSVTPALSTDEGNLLITTDTDIIFLSSAYRFVFGLDLSASLLRVDTFQHSVMIEAVLANLKICLLSLLQCISVQENIEIKPDIYVTIFAQWHGTKCSKFHQYVSERVVQKVLIQGCHLTHNVVPIVLQKVHESIYKSIRVDEPGRHKSALQGRDDILIGMLRTGLLALRLLPSNTSSGVVIITDGVLGEPNPLSLERLLKQCQNTTTSCSFVHVNPSANPLCDFGCISNVELMQFIASSTKGQYINAFNIPSHAKNQKRIYQQLLLSWTFQVKKPSSMKDIQHGKESFHNSCSSFELRNFSAALLDTPVILSKKQDERTVRADLLTVVSARLREGYEVKSSKVNKNVIVVNLILPWWKNCTSVEYRVSSSWPMQDNSCKVEVFITGTYEFLLDISKHQESGSWTRPRKFVVHRMLRFFQDLMHSDHMLQYLRGFTDDPVKYTISDSLRQGQTLYYLPPNSSQFEPSTQAKRTATLFSSYWKPILSLDVNIWHQWLHIQRIEVILQHDVPLPRHLHIVNGNSRYHSVQCRVAFSQMVSMLRDWCTFVLLENHTYVKFIYDSEKSDKPYSFFLVRLSSKSPALVLKLAFLIGLSGKIRKHYVREIREKVASLLIPVSGSSSSTSSKRVRHTTGGSRLSPNVKWNRSLHSASEKPCAIIMHKPVDQILVRYTQVPEDYLTNLNITQLNAKGTSDINEQAIRMRDMHWYLHHKRCTWSLTNNLSTPLSKDVACHLASLLLKIRMTEGFQIAYSSSGVVNLTKEFPMQTSFVTSNGDEKLNDFCLVQFIIFPPKCQSNCNNNSAGETDEEEDAEDSLNLHKEIVFAVEVWVEPQYGVVKQSCQSLSSLSNPRSNSPSVLFQPDNVSEVPYYEGLNSEDIISKIINRDSVCISTVVSLEHLQFLCNSSDSTQCTTFPQRKHSSDLPPHFSSHEECSSPYVIKSNMTDYQSIEEPFLQEHISRSCENLDSKYVEYHPCIFDLSLLLDQSPRMQHLFMLLDEGNDSDGKANATLLSNFHKCLKAHSDCTVNLSVIDQDYITQHMILRKNRLASKPNQCMSTGLKNSPSGSWSCYLKQGGNGQVLVTLLPTTYEDFLSLFNIVSVETGDAVHSPLKKQNAAEKSTSESFSHGQSVGNAAKLSLPEKCAIDNSTKVCRRLSIKRLASTSDDLPSTKTGNTNIKQRTFSVYVYNCSMQMVVSGFLQGAMNSKPIKWPDSLQDHRLFTEDVTDSFIQTYNTLSSSRQSPPSPPSTTCDGSDATDDVFPLISPENEHLQSLCRGIVEFYHRSFVVGIFSAVQENAECQFSTDDLQVATDYFCHEAVDEIDITDFVLLNCPQVAEFKSQNGNSMFPSGINPHTTAPFKSDNADIEDVCANQSIAAPDIFAKLEHVAPLSQDLSKAHSVNSAPGKNKKETVHERVLVDLLQPEHENSNQTKFLPSQFSITESRKSAFTTIPRFSGPRGSEFDNTGLSSSSEDEHEIRKTAPSLIRERKSRTTLPVKRVNIRKHGSVNLLAGWNNLPEFPVSLLDVPHCRHLSGSNEQVEKHFNSLLRSYCHSVPAVPYLHYVANTSNSLTEENIKSNKQQTESDMEDVQFISDTEDLSALVSNCRTTMSPNLLTSHLTLPLHFEDDDSSVSSENDKSTNPLFLYMTCTVRDKKSGTCGSSPVKCLPINLKYILDSLDKPCNTIDLSQIKITLDLSWIFLPPFHKESKVPSLPSECIPCVSGIKRKIRWLLDDEIVSSLRTCEPISTTTLKKVSDHVKSSKSSNCVMDTIPLQYIFGVEKSKELLCLEFEKLKIKNYKLKKEEQFYYLSLERAFVPVATSYFASTSSTKEDSSLQQQKDSTKENNFIDSNDSNLFGFNQSLSPKETIIKSVERSTNDNEHHNIVKTNSSTNPDHSSCISLVALDSDATETVRFEKRMKKASSSNELSTACLPPRRCISVSSMPFQGSAAKESNCHPSPLYINKQSLLNNPTIPSPLFTHPSLRMSLSTPLKTRKGNIMSMPVTPVGYANQEPDIFFFPLRNDGRQNSTVRDFITSPVSDCSPRQYSQVSLAGSGYEGEESSCEDEDNILTSFQEVWSQLPNFWLVVCISNDTANVYFHRRSSAKVMKAVEMEHNRILKIVSKNLVNACKAVNQILLLEKLHDTRLCHSLLVEESPEDIWKREDYSTIYHSASASDDLSADDVIRFRKNDYLAANMDFPPGHFECDLQLQQCITIYHRIAISGSLNKAGSGGSISSAMATVRAFMKNFTVVNQKNMFVYQVPDGTVYYCRMHEEAKKSEPSCRRSSMLQQSGDPTLYGTSDVASQVETEPKLVLLWYGVHALSPDHHAALEELKEGIVRKLEDTAVDYIIARLDRNPQYKLSPADVYLIQPRWLKEKSRVIPKLPNDTISFALSHHLVNEKSMPSFIYYTHQHLLLFLTLARYTDPNSAHFLPYYVNEDDTKNVSVRGAHFPGSLYMYNGLAERGGKGQGIACVCLDYTLKKEMEYCDPFDTNLSFEQLKLLSTVDKANKKDRSKTVIHFHSWTHGSLKVVELNDKLHTAVQHAVHDTIMEQLLQSPFTPIQYVKTEAMKNLFEESEKKETPFLQNFFLTKLGNTSKDLTHDHLLEYSNFAPDSILHGVYDKLMLAWLVDMKKQECPSVHDITTEFTSMISSDQGTQNIFQILCSVLVDSKLLAFTKIQNSNAEWKFVRQFSDVKAIPAGRYRQWLLLSRNFHLWKGATGTLQTPLNPSTSKILKFPPHDMAVKPDASPCPQHDLLVNTPYIRRQHFVYVVVKDKSAKIFLYNVSSDLYKEVSQQLQECSKFHKARFDLLQNLTLQSLGLFNHSKQIQDLTKNNDESDIPVDFLIKHNRVPIPNARKSRQSLLDHCVDDAFLNVPLTKDLNDSSRNSIDKVSQYGTQLIAILRHRKALKDVKKHFEVLRRRTPEGICNITQTSYNFILSCARLTHSMSSPILLDPAIRQKHIALFMKQQCAGGRSDKGETSKQLGVLSRTSSFLGAYRRRSGDSLNKLPSKYSPDVKENLSKEALPDICLKSFKYMSEKFAEFYAEHWRGFVKLHLQSTSGKVGEKSCSTPIEQSESKFEQEHYFYRALHGGVIVIVHKFMTDRFDVKLYCIDTSSFYEQTMNSKQKMRTFFIRECDKMKKNMKVHMFSLEMHVTCIKSYIDWNHSFIQSGYNFIDLLHGLTVSFGSLVDDFQSQIYHNDINLPCSLVNFNDLYDFIIENAAVFQLKSIFLTKSRAFDQQVLYTVDMSGEHISGCSAMSHDKYNIGAVISKSKNSEPGFLTMSYFILISHKSMANVSVVLKKSLPDAIIRAQAQLSKKLLKPFDAHHAEKQTIFKKHGTLSGTDVSIALSASEIQDVNYPPFVNCAKVHLEKMLLNIGLISRTECYRHNYLWSGLVQMCNEKGHTKRLNLVEFQTLLELMQTVQASKYDSNVSRILSKSWSLHLCQKAHKRLLKKFPKTSTTLSSSDNGIQYVCVLSQKIDIMAVLTVDISKCKTDFFVVQPRPEHLVFHAENFDSACLELVSSVCDVISSTIWLSWL